MSASYRSQANLHLIYAKRFLQCAERGAEDGDDWGGNYGHAMLQSAAFQLELAYRCHLCDLFTQRDLPPFYSRAADALAEDDEVARKVPELRELAEREVGDRWLADLLDFPFIGAPKQKVSRRSTDSLAVEAASDEPGTASLRTTLEHLEEVLGRHRDSMHEH